MLLNRTTLGKMTFIRSLVFMLYICAIVFVTTVALLFTGLNLKTQRHCKAAIYICLVFYVSCKILVQMFLVERAHAARYMLKQRRDDWMWYAPIDDDLVERYTNFTKIIGLRACAL